VPFQWPWEQPLDDIRAYLGEKVALYFQFLGHYTTWLLPLSVMGFAVFLDVAAEGNVNAPSVPFFALFVALWAVLMLEYWKRTESWTAMRTGMAGFETEQRDRPSYFGTEMKSHVDGKEIKYFPRSERNKRMFESLCVIAAMITTVIGLVALIFYLKWYLAHNATGFFSDNAATIASLLNAVQIQVMNYIYGEMATWLTERENHRTDIQYEDSLIAKLFAFQFVNSYASLFYQAFIKEAIGDPCLPDCMNELTYNLGIIFVTRLLSGNASELLLPRITSYLRKQEETKGVEPGTSFSRAEVEYVMLRYDPVMGPIGDFAEQSVQFGYVTLFVVAFPLAPLLAFISNYVEIRTDGNKILFFYQRPVPTGVEDIGTWQSILTLTSLASVVTNSALVAFTMSTLDGVDLYTRLWLFIVFQYFVFAMMGLFGYLVPDVPEEVEIQLGRQAHIVSKIIDAVPDEQDDFENAVVSDGLHVHDLDDEPAPDSGQ